MTQPSNLKKFADSFKRADKKSPSEGIHLSETLGKLSTTFGKFSNVEKQEIKNMAYDLIKFVGLNPKIVLNDGTIQDYEAAQFIAKAGYLVLEHNNKNCSLTDITEEKFPSAFSNARKFAKDMNLDLKGSDDILIGLAAFEIADFEEMAKNAKVTSVTSVGLVAFDAMEAVDAMGANSAVTKSAVVPVAKTPQPLH